MSAEIPVLLAVAFPVLMGILCYALRNRRSIAALSFISSAVLIATSLILFWMVRDNGGGIRLDMNEFAGIPVSELIMVLDSFLMFYFLYIGIKLKNLPTIIFAVLQMIPLFWFESQHQGAVAPSFYIDSLAVIMVLIVSIIGSLIVIYAIKYMEHDKKQARFFFFMLLFLGAMNGAVLSNNLLWLFFFWEVTTLCCYALIRHEETEEAIKSATRALVITLGGGVAFAVAIPLIFEYFGSVSFIDILAISPALGLAFIPVALIALAAFTKSAQIPFQSWLLGAMVAPTPVSALLHSATMVNLGVYVLIRSAPAIGLAPWLSFVIAVVGGFTFFVTALMAVSQVTIKRVLAYSTIGNLGLIVMCVGINTPLSLSAAILLLFFHAMSKALLFLSAGVVDHEGHTKKITGMEGMIRSIPVLAVTVVAAVMTMMMLPFGMFLGKWVALEVSTTRPELLLLTGFVIFGSVLTSLYYTKWLGLVLSAPEEPEHPPKPHPLSKLYTIPMFTLLAGAIFFSVFMGPVISELIGPAVAPYYGLTPMASDNITFFTPMGWVPSLLIFVLIVVAIFLPLKMFKSIPKEAVKPVYRCGEDFEQLRLKGFFYEREVPDDKITRYANPIAVILIIIMLGVIFI